jgi:hypothetical protein
VKIVCQPHDPGGWCSWPWSSAPPRHGHLVGQCMLCREAKSTYVVSQTWLYNVWCWQQMHMSNMMPHNIGVFSGNPGTTRSMQLCWMTLKRKVTPTQSFNFKAQCIYMMSNHDDCLEYCQSNDVRMVRLLLFALSETQ